MKKKKSPLWQKLSKNQIIFYILQNKKCFIGEQQCSNKAFFCEVVRKQQLFVPTYNLYPNISKAPPRFIKWLQIHFTYLKYKSLLL